MKKFLGANADNQDVGAFLGALVLVAAIVMTILF